MFCCFGKKNSKSGLVEASVANGALVVTSKHADAPRVWRGTLAFTSTAVLEMQEGDGKFRLVMKVAGAPVEEIIALSDRAAVQEAFENIAHVLTQEHGKAIAAKRSVWRKLAAVIGWLCFLAVTLFLISAALVMFYGPSQQQVMMQMQNGPTPQYVAPAPEENKTGVPRPASDIFGE